MVCLDHRLQCKMPNHTNHKFPIDRATTFQDMIKYKPCGFFSPLQHLKDYLDLDLSALRYMMTCYPEEKDEEQMRRSLGRYGLTGKQQVGYP